MSSNPRLRALNILQRIIERQKNLQECLTSEDAPFVYQLTYGALRHYFSLGAMVNYALKKPFPKSDHDLYLLLLLGLYQLEYLDVPEYAVLKETVNVADKIKKSWAKKLINAILRRYLREREAFKKQCLVNEQSQYDHPEWFIERIKKAYPEQWQKILLANNEKAPLFLRVNRLKISREDYLKQLDVPAKKLEQYSDAIILAQATDVNNLPGFKEGWFSVQDAASQAVVKYVDLKPGQRVLDACAAPGGKTCHMLEKEPEIAELVALDNAPARIKKITENLQRLGLKAHLICGDASTPEEWWDKKLFDRILLDAPCSATGVIRRHPDIKLLRTSQEIDEAVSIQKKILEALWRLLKENGLLIYTTCSILPEENQEQIEQFVKNHQDAQLIITKQLLPGNEENADGFFYSSIKKIS